MIRFSVIGPAVVAIAAIQSQASAGIVTGNVNVVHRYTTNSLPPTISTVLSGPTNGNFDTFDGKVGVRASLTATGETVRVDSYGATNPLGGGYIFAETSGSLDFSSHGGTFTPVLDESNVGGYTSFYFTITNLATNESWMRSWYGAIPPTTTGTLTPPMPAGDYRLDWDTRGYYMVGTTGSGSYTFSLAFTPEPTSLAVIGSVMVLARRRRR